MIAPVPPDELQTFGTDVAFRRQLQPGAARKHPGKIHLGFLAMLLTRYTQPGQTLLDPMAGSGSLLMATLPPWRCHVVLNELEAPWVGELCTTWLRLQGAIVPPVGTATIWAGDARTLAGRLLRSSDVILTSPPYADALAAAPGKDRHPERVTDRRSSMETVSAQYQAGYDTVITSPPYADALGAGEVGRGLQEYLATDPRAGRTSLLRHPTYDAVVTSPPYADALSPQRHSDDYHPERQAGHNRGTTGDAALRAQRRGYDPEARGKRGGNPAQIGNLSGKRYQAAMAVVYAQCAALVRPGGLVIVILKNIIRDHAEVDLVGQASAQLTALGLVVVRTHWRKTQIGAFHRIRLKRDPAALCVDREAALVYRRPEDL